MPLDKNSYNLKLYNLLKTRGYRPVPLDSKGERSEAPQEADVFKFTFSKDDEKVGTMYATVEEGDIVLYYDEDEVSKSSDANTSGTEFTDSFTGLIRHLKHWAMTRQLGFRTEPDDKLASDMAQREYMKKKENISEGYYPMGKSASYNDAVPTVKIILQHTRQIQEGEQRFRHVSKIFLENTLGERILAPTIRPGIAQVYARHIAEGGVPNDERWNHIKSLCEDYSKMAGFVRAVKNNQFNESAQQLVNEGVNHYQSLRETLGRMRGHRGYNAYFESWTPTLMEEENSDNTLNELFVQETLDPRIESVLPILSKLRKTVGEMKEVNELAEWAEELTEAPGAETLAHNEKTEKSRLDAFDLEESDDAVKAGQVARDKIKKPAFMRKAAGEKPATLGDVERSQQHRSSQAMVGQKGQEVEESGLQAYLGNKKYGKDGMDALRKAGRDGASKEKMAKIRAKYDKLDEEGVEETSDYFRRREREEAIISGQKPARKKQPAQTSDYARRREQEKKAEKGVAEGSGKNVVKSVKVGNFRHDLVDTGFGWQVRIYNGDELYDTGLSKNSEQKGLAALDDAVAYTKKQLNIKEQGVAEGWNDHLDDPNDYEGHLERLRDLADLKRMQDKENKPTDKEDNSKKKVDEINDLDKMFSLGGELPSTDRLDKDTQPDSQTDQFKLNTIKHLLKKNPSLSTDKLKKMSTPDLIQMLRDNLSEMDAQGYKGHRGDEDPGEGPEKVVKPAKTKDVAKDAEKELTKAMDKAHKKGVDEAKVLQFPQQSSLDRNVIVQLKSLAKTRLELSWEGPDVPSAWQGQTAQMNKQELARLSQNVDKQLKALGYEWSENEEDFDILYLHSIAREQWYDSGKPMSKYRGLPDLMYNADTNTLSEYDLIGDEESEYNSPKQFEGMSEDLDANQKRVGQLGPTEKVKNNNIGKLVGASESIQHDPLKEILRLSGK